MEATVNNSSKTCTKTQVKLDTEKRSSGSEIACVEPFTFLLQTHAKGSPPPPPILLISGHISEVKLNIYNAHPTRDQLN